jgi:hypothetical protein
MIRRRKTLKHAGKMKSRKHGNLGSPGSAEMRMFSKIGRFDFLYHMRV